MKKKENCNSINFERRKETRNIPYVYDNQFWGGTDFAHPAWWRGEERGTKALVYIIHKFLIGEINTLMVI